MKLHERFIYSVLGAIWGAVLGLLLALFFHLVLKNDFDNGFFILNWKNTILGCATIFAVAGLIFKESTGAYIGVAMNWIWSAIIRDRETGHHNFWLNLLILAIMVYLVYGVYKGLW